MAGAIDIATYHDCPDDPRCLVRHRDGCDPREFSREQIGQAWIDCRVTLKAPDEAMHLTTDHMKSAYETFTAEAKKIGEMYKTFFASFTPSATISKALEVV